MNNTTVYYKQVQLLVQIMPLIFKTSLFALKGGTAINLFVRNMPRLSVDIDLVYLGEESRNEALLIIRTELDSIAQRIMQALVGSMIHKTYQEKPDALRLVISYNGVTVKVELSPVLRGTVFPVETQVIAEAVEDEFGFVEAPLVSIADLYGGKICAALDRQHPRDLYDVKLLLENEGFTDDIRKATLVYIMSHPKPMSELFSPRLKDIEELYNNEFDGMTNESVSLKELLQARDMIISLLHKRITHQEKQLLLSFKSMNPQWDLFELKGIEKLPAIKWKQINLAKIDKEKHLAALAKLESVLGDS